MSQIEPCSTHCHAPYTCFEVQIWARSYDQVHLIHTFSLSKVDWHKAKEVANTMSLMNRFTLAYQNWCLFKETTWLWLIEKCHSIEEGGRWWRGGGCSFIMVLLFPSSKPNSFDMYKQEKEVNKQCAISKRRHVLFGYLSYIYRWVACGLMWLQEQTPKRHLFEKDWVACSKFRNRFETSSRLNSQHNWGGPIWPLNKHKNRPCDYE